MEEILNYISDYARDKPHVSVAIVFSHCRDHPSLGFREMEGKIDHKKLSKIILEKEKTEPSRNISNMGGWQSEKSLYKDERFSEILKEVELFFDIHKSENTIASGVHFEMTGQEVTECTGGAQEISDEKLGDRYRTHCDPRLNASQALEMAFLTAEALKKIREEKNSQKKNIIANN